MKKLSALALSSLLLIPLCACSEDGALSELSSERDYYKERCWVYQRYLHDYCLPKIPEFKTIENPFDGEYGARVATTDGTLLNYMYLPVKLGDVVYTYSRQTILNSAYSCRTERLVSYAEEAPDENIIIEFTGSQSAVVNSCKAIGFTSGAYTVDGENLRGKRNF